MAGTHRRFGARSVVLTRRRALALSGAAAFLAACGGDSDESAPSGGGEAAAGAGAGAQASTPMAQAAEPPVVGGTFTWSDTGDAPLDPTNNTTYRAQTLAGYLYSRLLKFKTGPLPETALNYELVPDLAAGHELIGDGTQLTFTLQPSAQFINKAPVNAREVISEDVKASFDRFRTAPRNTNKGAFGTEASPLVTAVETPDPKTVVVKLARPYAAILNLFANPQYMWILPREADSGFDPAKDAIGSGPWMLERVEPDRAITLRRNPNYFLQGKPYIETVVRAVIADTAQNIAQFQAGRLDVYGVPPQQSAEVQKSKPDAQVLKLIPPSFEFMSPQQRDNSPFRDVRLRRALSMALDRKSVFDLTYVEGMRYNSAIPASMGKWWLDPAGSDIGPGGAFVTFDPKAARDLLKAAGMENMPIRFLYTNNGYGDSFNQRAEAIAGMLKEGGFTPTIVTQDYLREFLDSKGTFFGNYEGVFYNPQTSFTDPHDYLFSMSHPSSGRNHAGINDPRLTQMMDDEERTLDEAARVQKMHDIQRYWLEQMFYVPTVLGNTYSFRQPWMKNYYYSATYGSGAEGIFNAWIKK
jgi:peptide/nickel transport system substrate-binding protein